MKNQANQAQTTSAHIFVRGLVQGVGFRYFTQDCANKLRLSGMVKNLADGRVELKVTGERKHLEALILKLQDGPERSRVEALDVSWGKTACDEGVFSIAYS